MIQPALDRNDVAVRLACAYIAVANPDDEFGRAWAAQVVATTDALLFALTPPTVAPVAPPAGKYEPKVGDVVRVSRPWTGDEWVCFLDADWHNREDSGIVAPTTDFCRDSGKVSVVRASGSRREDIHGVEADRLTFVRPATPSERAAVGLPPESTPAIAARIIAQQRAAGLPAPEAKRPTQARFDTEEDCCGTCYTATWCEAGRACLSTSTPRGDREVAERIVAAARGAKTGGE